MIEQPLLYLIFSVFSFADGDCRDYPNCYHDTLRLRNNRSDCKNNMFGNRYIVRLILALTLNPPDATFIFYSENQDRATNLQLNFQM